MATKEKNRAKIAIVTTIGLSLDKLFPDFYPLVMSKGYEVVGICAQDNYVENVRRQGIRVITVPMTRDFAPVQDLKCLWLLYRIFKREKFDLIHYSTPKASLLSVLAASLAGRAILLYTLRGLIHTSFAGGVRRFITRFCEKIACRSANYVIAISDSLKKEVIQEGLLPENRIHVIGAGSSKGVNLQQFELNSKTAAEAASIRQNLGIRKSGIVIGYAGRLTEEKGIAELLMAFSNIRRADDRVRLLLIGDIDKRNPLPDKIIQQIKTNNSIYSVPFNDNVAGFMAATDIFVLPSYRDGFGNVLIEASAMSRPVIGTDISGCRDAVLDGKTGMLVKARDVTSLENALRVLVDNQDKREKMGINGRKWVEENFDRKIVWEKLMAVYDQLLGNATT